MPGPDRHSRTKQDLIPIPGRLWHRITLSRSSASGSAIACSFLLAMLRAEYISTIFPRANTML